MSDHRPAIPRPLARAVLVEAGHRCAIPTCRATTTEISHIVPWSEVREHTLENLIALCPNCHSRYDRGEIDRRSMVMYKRNLGLLGSRYGESERRLMEMFVQNPGITAFQAPHPMDFEFMYLLKDGLVRQIRGAAGIVTSGPTGTVWHGPVQYVLTAEGVDLVERLRKGVSLESELAEGQPEHFGPTAS
jgi:hypothetical protein